MRSNFLVILIILLLISCKKEEAYYEDIKFSFENIEVPKSYKKYNFYNYLKNSDADFNTYDGSNINNLSFYKDTIYDNFLIIQVFSYKKIQYSIMRDKVISEFNVRLVKSNKNLDIYKLSNKEGIIEKIEESEYYPLRINKHEFYEYSTVFDIKKDSLFLLIRNLVNFNTNEKKIEEMTTKIFKK